MRRREFIAGLGSAAAWPHTTRAQQARPVTGFLNPRSADDDYKDVIGYVKGQNVAVKYRYAKNQPDRLPVLACDLVRRRVAVTARRDSNYSRSLVP
jgi:putative ABC transport system substrate-binding protein